MPIDQIKLIDFTITPEYLEIEHDCKFSSADLHNLTRDNTESSNTSHYKQNYTSSCNLDETILSVTQKITPDYSIFTNQLAELSSYLCERLKPLLGNDASYHFYGSTATRLYTYNSDIDLSINLPCTKPRQAQLKLLRRIGEYLKKIYPQRITEERFTARVPLLHWSNGANSGNNCAVDICINNHLGIANSALVSKYVGIDDRVASLIIAIKKWAKSRDINNKSRGSLSSFALVLMVIHYLQKVVTPPILPFLQDIAISNNIIPNFISGFDCRYASDDLLRRGLAEMHDNYGKNIQSLGQLLLGLFRYYCQRTSDSPIISINQLGRFKSELYEFSLRYFVENPFEPGIDVANIPFNMESKIGYEFSRAYNILQSGGTYPSIL